MSGATSGASAPTGSSYTEKLINITLTLGQGTFGASGMDTVKLSGLRCAATITKGGFPSMDRGEVRIYGVQPSVMNELSTLGIYSQIMARVGNSVLIEAGDAVNGMSIVYFGSIVQSYANYDGAPETFMQIVGTTGQLGAMQPAPPISFPGSADVATIMAGLATRLGYQFENGGVQVRLASPYFAGTALAQAHAVARAANIELTIDSGTGTPTLAIWPKTGVRKVAIPLINAASGLVGYPRFDAKGMAFTCLFNPNLRIGGEIQMQSTVGAAATPASAGNPTPPPAPATPAPAPSPPSGDTVLPEVVVHAKAPPTQAGGPNGIWRVNALSYNLSAQLPGGPWFCDVVCARTNVPGG